MWRLASPAEVPHLVAKKAAVLLLKIVMVLPLV